MQMTKHTIESITAGESWGCKFRIKTWVDEQTGQPVEVRNLQPGQPVQGATPGDWESIGIIKTRDTKSQLVELIDTHTDRTWTVPFADCWDIDRVEFQD